MDRFHLNVPKMLARSGSDPLAPSLFPLLNSGNMSTPGASNAAFPLAPSSMTLARLSCTPCFNRRLFTPNSSGLRQKADHLERLATSSSNGQFTNYMEWGQLHLDLDRFAQRYQLNSGTPSPSVHKNPRATSSPQPEDLSLTTKEDAPLSGDEEDELSSSDASKSPAGSALKFSIDAILGSKDTKKKSNKCSSLVTRMPNKCGPRDATSACSSPGQQLALPDPDPDCNPDDDDDDEAMDGMPSVLGSDRAPDGMMAEGERFSWLQCTRYKPPKLPRSKKKDGSKKRKLGRNPRVPFTQHQVNILEQKFRQTHYLSSVDVAELSAALNLTETRVKIWFQNRRARERRDRENMQLLQGGAASSQSGKSKTPPGGGVDRLSPESSLHRSPREQRQADLSPGSVGLLSTGHRLDLPGAAAGIGLGGLSSQNMPTGPWGGPLTPKPGVLAHFASSQLRSSAFTPVSYFSYS